MSAVGDDRLSRQRDQDETQIIPPKPLAETQERIIDSALQAAADMLDGFAGEIARQVTERVIGEGQGDIERLADKYDRVRNLVARLNAARSELHGD